jgi:FlaA1/EpsC-like NDP-sugar epimerase
LAQLLLKSGTVDVNRRVNALANLLRELPPGMKISIGAGVDFSALCCVVLAAYALRLSALQFPPSSALSLYFVAPLISVAVAYLVGVYHSAARSYSSGTEIRIIASQVLAVIVWTAWVAYMGTSGFARSVLLIYLLLAIGVMMFIRRLAAHFFVVRHLGGHHADQIPVMIYGAGHEGEAVVSEMRRSPTYKPVAFVDTDYTLIGRAVQGIKVFTVEELPAAILKHNAREIIVAKPNLTRAHRRSVVNTFMQHGLAVKVAPGIQDIIGGQVTIGDIRPVNVEDLLGRDPVPPKPELMQLALAGKVVMITGAGGSIGSELVRQALPFMPTKILLVEHNEFSLFEVHRSLLQRVKAAQQDVAIVPLLLDVKDQARMASVMREHGVHVVFHAAAYKHVHLVQENVPAGIENNVTGTIAVAEAARETGVERFILVSTDKAVRPTSAMGASKRVAELYVQALSAERIGRTIFSMVRFGNVLGSTGSVVPLFREQIAAGGPITVTDPEVTRYFMLIPEAAQLVIQAGAISKGGDVFVLDMGEPIKITQLADAMIELAGLTRKSDLNPDGDIEIVFTGLKDGEKLYEELEIGTDLTPTIHERIMRAREFFLPMSELRPKLAALKARHAGVNSTRELELLMGLAHVHESN